MLTNQSLSERICNVITVWGFGSSVVMNAISQFLESDVAAKHLPSLAEWRAALSFAALGLLVLATLAWAISYISAERRGAEIQPMSADQSQHIQDAISVGLKTLHLGQQVSTVTTTFSEGKTIFLHGDVEYEGKVTVHTSPKDKKT